MSATRGNNDGIEGVPVLGPSEAQHPVARLDGEHGAELARTIALIASGRMTID